MMISPFSILLALLPLVGYLVLLGSIRLFGRTLVTTGARDIAALGVALSGLIAVGPIELFFPTAAAAAFGPYVWLSLAVFYALCVSLVAITSPPKLVVYGRSAEEVLALLVRAAAQLDSASSGDASKMQVVLPTLGVRLRVDGQPGADWAQIFAFEPDLTPAFWARLQNQLRQQVSTVPGSQNLKGLTMLVAAVVLACFLVWQSMGREALVVEGFRNWLWR